MMTYASVIVSSLCVLPDIFLSVFTITFSLLIIPFFIFLFVVILLRCFYVR